MGTRFERDIADTIERSTKTKEELPKYSLRASWKGFPHLFVLCVWATATMVDLVECSGRGLLRALKQIPTPCLLVVDPLAFPIVSLHLAKILTSGRVANVVSLADSGALRVRNNDAICKDASETRRVVALITSRTGERLWENYRATLDSDFDFSRLTWEDAPVALVPTGQSCFVLSCEPVPAPIPIMFGSTASNTFDLDVATDVSAEYKASLKFIAHRLADAIYDQLEWDVSDAIYSIGFGSSLLAHTLSAKLDQIKESNPGARSKASLLVIDRTVDLAMPLRDSKLAPYEKLFKQLIVADQVTDIVQLITQAVQDKNISQSQGLGLVLQCASFAGEAWQAAVDELATVCGVSMSHLKQLLNQISQARAQCERNKDEEVVIQFGKSMDPEIPGLETILRSIFDSRLNHLPSYVNRAQHKVDVAKVALNLFGSVFGGDSQKKNSELTVRDRANLVVFIIGGYCESEVRCASETFSILVPQGRLILAGTETVSRQHLTNEYIGFLSQRSPGAIANLF